MATLTAEQTMPLWRGGECERFVLFAVKNVTTGDTVDLSATFRVVLQTSWMGATVSGVAPGTFNGTTATAPPGLATAGAYLLVQGVAV